MTGKFDRIKRWGRLALVVCLLAVLTIGGYAAYLVAHHNFHAVVPGKLFRSAQMDADALASTIQENGIKTIVNLRGGGPEDGWYSAETNTARRLGVEHFDFALSAGREVSDEEMERILATIRNAPKPVLIHCKSGSDRTGLVGALCLYNLEGESANSADRELSFWYGHVPYLFWRNTIAMDRSYWRYVSNHLQQAKTAGAAAVPQR